MSKPAARVSDLAKTESDSHGCPACPHVCVGPGIVGSPTVFINGLPALRKGDMGVHAACCAANMWETVGSSGTVFINGKKAVREGDDTRHCGGTGKMIKGSGDVNFGD